MRSTISSLNVRFQELAIIAASLLMMTACGSTVAKESTSGSASTSGVASASATATPTGNIYNLPSALAFNAQITGATGAYPTAVSSAVATSRTLKVKVTPLSAPNWRLAGYTNWVSPYGCLRVQVKVNGVTQTTSILRVDGASTSSACPNAPTYQVLDFTNYITGNGTVTATVSNAEYDNCRNWGNPLMYGCTMSAIYMTHEVAATIQVEADGTYMSE